MILRNYWENSNFPQKPSSQWWIVRRSNLALFVCLAHVCVHNRTLHATIVRHSSVRHTYRRHRLVKCLPSITTIAWTIHSMYLYKYLTHFDWYTLQHTYPVLHPSTRLLLSVVWFDLFGLSRHIFHTGSLYYHDLSLQTCFAKWVKILVSM